MRDDLHDMVPIDVQVRRLDDRAALPQRMTSHAAGWDLRACLDASLCIAPGQRARIPTGLALAIPSGFEGQVRARSGLAFRRGVTVLNGPGTIDADYRGELGVLVINLGPESFTVEHGDRIAQLVIAAVPTVQWSEVDALPEPTLGEDEAVRGSGGFGSTGES